MTSSFFSKALPWKIKWILNFGLRDLRAIEKRRSEEIVGRPRRNVVFKEIQIQRRKNASSRDLRFSALNLDMQELFMCLDTNQARAWTNFREQTPCYRSKAALSALTNRFHIFLRLHKIVCWSRKISIEMTLFKAWGLLSQTRKRLSYHIALPRCNAPFQINRDFESRWNSVINLKLFQFH